MAKRKTNEKRLITCRPTELNVWVLGRIAAGRREFPNKLCATSVPHMRRCMKGGLVEVVGVEGKHDRLRITEAGRQAIGDAHVHGHGVELIERDYSPEIVE